jgi:hypothetical protein
MALVVYIMRKRSGVYNLHRMAFTFDYGFNNFVVCQCNCNSHSSGKTDDDVEILHYNKKGSYVDTIEKLHI